MAYKPAGIRNYLPEEIEAIRLAFEDYVESSEYPILAEFAYKNNISKYLLDRPELSHIKERCLAKKESVIEVGAMQGKYNPTMSIFSLKQLGWRDKTEIENTHRIETIQLVTMSADDYRAQQEGETDGR